ncbi:hypothetical protein BV22DRAFT_1052165 [Leucogyrophana mollusca]|uniref:Uncharacterized protein n=1 Tax=Leucogyrophana mollusca TaxID=85980 RepID=A0ACB8AWD6_9AGAM|nr:hypothetical protein BV22DRAFT_1052165 [Leucogyrophana mollusca]
MESLVVAQRIHPNKQPGQSTDLYSQSSIKIDSVLEDREAFYVRQANKGLLRGSMTSTYREEHDYMEDRVQMLEHEVRVMELTLARVRAEGDAAERCLKEVLSLQEGRERAGMLPQPSAPKVPAKGTSAKAPSKGKEAEKPPVKGGAPKSPVKGQAPQASAQKGKGKGKAKPAEDEVVIGHEWQDPAVVDNWAGEMERARNASRNRVVTLYDEAPPQGEPSTAAAMEVDDTNVPEDIVFEDDRWYETGVSGILQRDDGDDLILLIGGKEHQYMAGDARTDALSRLDCGLVVPVSDTAKKAVPFFVSTREVDTFLAAAQRVGDSQRFKRLRAAKEYISAANKAASSATTAQKYAISKWTTPVWLKEQINKNADQNGATSKGSKTSSLRKKMKESTAGVKTALAQPRLTASPKEWKKWHEHHATPHRGVRAIELVGVHGKKYTIHLNAAERCLKPLDLVQSFEVPRSFLVVVEGRRDEHKAHQRTVRGRLLVANLAPELSREVGASEQRCTTFHQRAAELITIPGFYREHVEVLGLNINTTRTFRRYNGHLENLMVADVARWLAENGVSLAEVDDAWLLDYVHAAGGTLDPASRMELDALREEGQTYPDAHPLEDHYRAVQRARCKGIEPPQTSAATHCLSAEQIAQEPPAPSSITSTPHDPDVGGTVTRPSEGDRPLLPLGNVNISEHGVHLPRLGEPTMPIATGGNNPPRDSARIDDDILDYRDDGTGAP